MWMMRRKSAEELDGILYFLSNALTSVMEDNGHLAHHGAMVPQIGAGLATAEIASRLAMFREQVCDVSQREFMVVTKLARARHWARELRRHEPHLRADIDAFLSVTARCETMARNRAPDPESLFDGEAHPKRFLAGRVPAGRSAAEAALSLMERLQAAERGDPLPDDGGPRYLIGGELSVEALDEACERLLARLSAHYGWEDGLPDAIEQDGAAALEDEAAGALPAADTEQTAAVDAGEADEARDAPSCESVTEDSPEADASGEADAGSAGEQDTPADDNRSEADDPFARVESEPASAENRKGHAETTQAT